MDKVFLLFGNSYYEEAIFQNKAFLTEQNAVGYLVRNGYVWSEDEKLWKCENVHHYYKIVPVPVEGSTKPKPQTYYGSPKVPSVGDKVICFSDYVLGMRMFQPTTVVEVDEWGNVRVQRVAGWYNSKHFSRSHHTKESETVMRKIGKIPPELAPDEPKG